MRIEKKKRIVNRAYLRWIKKQPCTVLRLPSKHECGGPMDAHHATPVSLGGSDYTAIPLCREAHTYLQSSVASRPWMLDVAEELHSEWKATNPRPLRESPFKRKLFQKRTLRRGYGVLLSGDLLFPIVETKEELKKLKKGRVVRVQVRIEGVK